VRGRVQTDYEKADQDTAIAGFPDLSATELRRARLGVEGIAWWDFKYVFEVDFANDDTRVKDAYLQYQGLKLSDTPLLFRVGNFKTPNSFEQMTSDLFVDTVERAAFINASTDWLHDSVLDRPFRVGGRHLRRQQRTCFGVGS
jgi:phosphate-selective porin OprO/OprP